MHTIAVVFSAVVAVSCVGANDLRLILTNGTHNVNLNSATNPVAQALKEFQSLLNHTLDLFENGAFNPFFHELPKPVALPAGFHLGFTNGTHHFNVNNIARNFTNQLDQWHESIQEHVANFTDALHNVTHHTPVGQLVPLPPTHHGLPHVPQIDIPILPPLPNLQLPSIFHKSNNSLS